MVFFLQKYIIFVEINYYEFCWIFKKSVIRNYYYNCYFIVDFYSGLEIKKTISFDNFNCKTEQSSYRGRGSSTSCFLITSDGTKYFLPNNVNFGDNLKKEDKLLVIKTFFLNQNKRFEIKYKNYVETADISFFQSKLNVTILIISLVVAVLFSCFSDNIIFGNLFVFCLVIDCFLILMYFLNF